MNKKFVLISTSAVSVNFTTKFVAFRHLGSFEYVSSPVVVTYDISSNLETERELMYLRIG